MMGMSRTIADGKTVAYEFLLIREDEQGGIQYVAKPSGQPEASFKLVKSGPKEVVFENPTHDFPQKISYRLEPDGSLLAELAGVDILNRDYASLHVPQFFDCLAYLTRWG